MIVVYSYLFVFGIIGISTLLHKYHILNGEGARKFIHIGVGNWIIIAYFWFDNPYYAIIPPFTFIILNYLSYRFNVFKAMERSDKTINDLGTVYYAISLFIVVLLDFLLFGEITFSVFPILVLAYGDGLCAVVGSRFESKKLIGNKTIYGAITMFFVTVILAMSFGYGLLTILVLAGVATFVELWSPKGLDNITLPLILYVILASGLVG